MSPVVPQVSAEHFAVPNFDPHRIQLLVFDWDGTLMDSVATIVACTQAALRDIGLGELPEATIRNTIGLGLRETAEILHPGCDDEMFARIMESYRKHWFGGGYRDRPVLFRGVGPMLQALADEGFLLAVATGKSRRGLDHVLTQTGLDGIFQATRTVDEAFSKPHPQMLLDILEDLGVRAEEALMIGDTTFDLQMARNARTASLGVCTGSHCREELERLDPVACLERVVELPDWFATVRAEAVSGVPS